MPSKTVITSVVNHRAMTSTVISTYADSESDMPTAHPSDNLYHIKWTMSDGTKDPSGASQTVSIAGTFTDPEHAKLTAIKILQTSGLGPQDFATYHLNNGQRDWTHGAGTILYAVAPAGERHIIALETCPNPRGLCGNADGRLQGNLWHILQTNIFYDHDGIGGHRETHVQGTWDSWKEAAKGAKQCLIVLGGEGVLGESAEAQGDECFVEVVRQM